MGRDPDQLVGERRSRRGKRLVELATGETDRADVDDATYANYLVAVAMACGHTPAEARAMSIPDLERLEIVFQAMHTATRFQ